MKNKKGFTLTEVLLAVMIVGLIGVALASLTRASARESGVARAKILLRNNLSVFSRMVRDDVFKASKISYIQGDDSDDDRTLLRVEQNMKKDGSKANSALIRQIVAYCYVKGGDCGEDVQPEGSCRDGAIYRVVTSSNDVSGALAEPTCDTLSNNQKVLLNVKDVNTATYQSPGFYWGDPGQISMDLIVELDSKPVTNESFSGTFVAPVGVRRYDEE